MISLKDNFEEVKKIYENGGYCPSFDSLKKEYEWHLTFMEIAKIFAKHSTCIRKQVGAVIVKDKRIISTGYNGVPSGIKHCNEVFDLSDELNKEEFMKKHRDFSSMYELHAEQNAIAFAAKNSLSVNGASIYCTLSPCRDCLKLISAVGIKDVYFNEVYDRESLDELDKRAITLGITLYEI